MFGEYWILRDVFVGKVITRDFLVTDFCPHTHTLRVMDLVIKILPGKEQGSLEVIWGSRICLEEGGVVHSTVPC